MKREKKGRAAELEIKTNDVNGEMKMQACFEAYNRACLLSLLVMG